jgi:hypothetical protein
MDKAAADRIEHQLRPAFPEGAITRVQVLQYGDDPEVEPGQTVIRVFFDWPGRSKGEQANPKTVHAFLTGNAAALDMLRYFLAISGAPERRAIPPPRWPPRVCPQQVPEKSV